MNKSLYKQVLNSPRWAELRREKYAQNNGCCEHCKKLMPIYKLSLHHKNYQCLGREQHSDVELLCAVCHIKADHRRYLSQTNIMSKFDFLIVWADRRKINPQDITSDELNSKYADYINWLYCKRCK